jgi:hypothetical protein
MDILDHLAFLESEQHADVILIEPLYYAFKAEFGMSTVSGILKVPSPPLPCLTRRTRALTPLFSSSPFFLSLSLSLFLSAAT